MSYHPNAPPPLGESRNAAKDAILAATESGATIVDVHGPASADIAGLIEAIPEHASDPRCRYFAFDVADCATAQQVTESACEALRPSQATWRHVTQLRYALYELRNGSQPIQPSLAATLAHLHHCHGPIHCHRAREARRRLRALPDADSPELSKQLQRTAGLELLLYDLLFKGLVASTKSRLVDKRIVLLVTGHEQYAASLAYARSGDFAQVLARYARAAGAPITVVLARETRLRDDVGTVHIPIASAERAPLPAPAASQSPVDARLQEHDAVDRHLIGLAAAPRDFGRQMLAVVTGIAVGDDWIHREVRRGTLEPVDVPTGDEPRWRVEPSLRAALFEALATHEDGPLQEGHRRAFAHLRDLPPPDDTARFERRLRLAYHRAALTTQPGFDMLDRLADEEIRRHDVANCQSILEAVEDLHAPTPAAEARTVLIKVKLYSDLRSSSSADAILEEAAARHPLDGDLDPLGVTVALQRAKLDRLRGNYELALARYEQVEDEALVNQHTIVLTYCHWQISLVRARMHEVTRAETARTLAESGMRGLLKWGSGSEAEAEAAKYGIRKMDLKPAHLLRQESELRRLSGDYIGAHELLSRGNDVYKQHGDVRALAYADVVRSNISRLEGHYDRAISQAVSVRERFDNGTVPDERLRARALRAEIPARIANGEAPYADAEDLAATPDEVDPAAKAAGLLALGEIYRRRQRWPEAATTYGLALGAAITSGVHGDAAGALIGMLECHRSGADLDQPSGLLPRDYLLSNLLALPCLDELPWVAVRAQLLRAYWHEDERRAAFREATNAAALFRRRPDDARIEDDLVTSFATALNGGESTAPPIWLALL